jgi:hypothetical protein
MGTHEVSATVVRQRTTALRWFLIGFALVLGIGVIAFGAALVSTRRANESLALSEDVLRAHKIQRFGEWYTPAPAQAALSATEGWGTYRAGERGPHIARLSATADAWHLYRAGERVSQVAPTLEPPPPGWAAYRAGERLAE